MKITVPIIALILTVHFWSPVKGHPDSCLGSLNASLVNEVIALALFTPEGNLLSYTPSTIYYNCYGNAREVGKYSSLSATLDFDLSGGLKYTREDFTCVNNNWVPNGLATQYFDPSTNPSQSRSITFSKKDCALCAITGSSDDYHCNECSLDCNDTLSNYPTCFGTGKDKCCNYLLNDYCVNVCPFRYTLSNEDNSTCVCADFWTGDDCETCSLSCLNGGTLKADCSSCTCESGFTGLECETEIDYCATQPCLNSGNCTYDRYGYHCSCIPGFTDSQCSTEIDFCYPYPCQNRAVCQNSPDGYSCQCQKGSSGTHCETLDYCYSNPCQNNGICSNHEDGYECKCKSGFIGESCENIDHCYQHMCENNATCINYPDRYQCNCSEGFFGQLCQNEVTPCSPDPCNNFGICNVISNGGFNCTCHNAYTGTTCEVEVNHCENITCQNNGTCANEYHGFICTCRAGFTGRYCEDEIDYCGDTPCENGGVCEYDRYGYNCSCPLGFSGMNCLEIILFCEPNLCKNNGTCNNTLLGYNCSCLPGYTGVTCEVDNCKYPRCQRGKCLETAGGYRCVCEVGYTGQNCSELIGECSEDICFNGGNCTEQNGNFTCECREPYTGRLCELVDPDKVCSHIKCEHGARCNSSLLQSADQSQLQQLLDGKTAVSPCECVGYWEGTFCNECPLCDESNSDCSECNCKGLWSGPDCTECSGHENSLGECVENPSDNANDRTDIIPILIPSLLGLGGIGAIPFLGCVAFKCKKSCKRRRRPKITVHVIHKDSQNNGNSKSNKKNKVNLNDQISQQLCTITNELDSPTHSVVSAFTASEKSKHSSDLPEYLASGVYDRLPPASDAHRLSNHGSVRFGSQSSGGLKVKLRSPLASVPDESELRLINSSELIKQGYTNHSESSHTEHAI